MLAFNENFSKNHGKCFSNFSKNPFLGRFMDEEHFLKNPKNIGLLLNVFIKSNHRYQNFMKLAIQKSSQKVNMTYGLATGGFQKTFQYETPCIGISAKILKRNYDEKVTFILAWARFITNYFPGKICPGSGFP